MAILRSLFSAKHSKLNKKEDDIHPLFETKGIDKIIYEYLDFDDQVMMSFSSEKVAISSDYQIQKNIKVHTFLEMVAEGNEDEAKKCLAAIPLILFSKSNIADKPQRIFSNVSGFQYALWAIDISMLNMFLESINQLPEQQKLISRQIAKQQLIEVEKIGLSYSLKMSAEISISINGSRHYNFKDIEDILIKFIQTWPMERINSVVKAKLERRNFSIFKGRLSNIPLESEWQELKYMWCMEVGAQQYLMPAHLIQEYCHPLRSMRELCDEFYKVKDCKKEISLPRNLEKIRSLKLNDNKLGFCVALSRGAAKSINVSLELLMDPIIDLQAIKIIQYLNTKAYNQIMLDLMVTEIKPLQLPEIPKKDFEVPKFISDQEKLHAQLLEIIKS